MVATEETTDDDNTASEDIEDYVQEEWRDVKKIENQYRKTREEEEEGMKHQRSGGSDARSVMAQCGSDSGDSSDPDATQDDMFFAKGKRHKQLEGDKIQMRSEGGKSQGAKCPRGRDVLVVAW